MIQSEFPYMPYVAIYLVTAGLLSSDTRCATHWRLSEQDGVVRIIPGEASREMLEADPYLSILTRMNSEKTDMAVQSWSHQNEGGGTG